MRLFLWVWGGGWRFGRRDAGKGAAVSSIKERGEDLNFRFYHAKRDKVPERSEGFLEMKTVHKPVLLEEGLGFLQVRPGEKYIDATVGEGGHSFEIAKRGGLVLGIDRDPKILAEARRRMREGRVQAQVKLVRGNFDRIDKLAEENGFTKVGGVFFDLGVSSWQLERSGRGFSFRGDEPLDMRVDPALSVTAADLLNGLSKHELEKLLQKFGEEERASQLASALVRARSLKSFATTLDLVRVVERVRRRWGRRHPATKVFQALRIAVNDEIENLRSALPRAFGVLGGKGRLVVISFHSLEDREVKRFFRRSSKSHLGKILTERPVLPGRGEVAENPRSRSAKLRVIEKI